MEGKPFKLRSGNKPAFKMMGAKSPANMGHKSPTKMGHKSPTKAMQKDAATKAMAPNKAMEKDSAAKRMESPAKRMESPSKRMESPAKAGHKSPMEKQLVGNQKNLNEGLKKAIEAAPGKMKNPRRAPGKMKSPMTKKKDAIGPKGSATIPAHIRRVYPKLTNEAYNKDKSFYDKASQAVIKGKKSPATMNEKSAMKQKMNMVKGPDGKMVPDFAVDGKGSNDMKSGVKKKHQPNT
tara:strand:+ start:1293 stop:2000 length:708 start_codon:yes stop_codon:yes gene_type:complete